MNREDRSGLRLFALGTVVGLGINLFYFEAGIGMSLLLLLPMGFLCALAIGGILQVAEAVIGWISKPPKY
jgi:hypothetical protein